MSENTDNKDIINGDFDDEVVLEEIEIEETDNLEDPENQEKKGPAKCSDFKENGVEWLNGQAKVCFTFSQIRFINKVKELAQKYPDEVDIVAENLDGSVTGHMPLSYFKISRPRELTEEQRQRAVANLVFKDKEKK